MTVQVDIDIAAKQRELVVVSTSKNIKIFYHNIEIHFIALHCPLSALRFDQQPTTSIDLHINFIVTLFDIIMKTCCPVLGAGLGSHRLWSRQRRVSGSSGLALGAAAPVTSTSRQLGRRPRLPHWSSGGETLELQTKVSEDYTKFYNRREGTK